MQTVDPLVSLILRSYNEGWALRQSLPALWHQEYENWELIAIDSGSTDGSVALLQTAQPRHLVQIPHAQYRSGRVLNLGLRLARAEFCIFLNADATPQGPDWLRPLVNALRQPDVAAVFGRQVPRPGCQAVYAADYHRCFGPQRDSARWEHFFSLVSSGTRKSIWAQRGFSEDMPYSEDDEYTRWCRRQGYQVLYCPESVVMHSHNYTPAQAYRRSYGEGRALAAVWTGRRQTVNFWRTVLLGWLADAGRDSRFCWAQGRCREWPHALRIRWQQRCGKLAGFAAGWEYYRQ